MPDSIPNEQAEGDFSHQFQDPAFEPRSSYDFEDELNLIENNMATFNTFNPDNMDFAMMESML